MEYRRKWADFYRLSTKLILGEDIEMNSEVYKLNKTAKKRSQIEQLLMVDHSDIYFENEKLGDRLNRYLHELRKDYLKNVILRDTEIKELNREIDTFTAILRTSEIGRKIREKAEAEEEEESKQNIHQIEPTESERASNLKRRLRALTPDLSDFKSYEERHKVRIKSSLEIFQEEPDIPKTRTPSPESEKENDKRTTIQPHSRNSHAFRSHSNLSGLNRQRKLKERIDTSDFPEEWFTTVVPASDAVIARVRRHKSAPLHQELKMLRAKKKPEEMKEEEDSGIKEDEDSNEEAKGLKVICSTPVRPVVMSLRQLKEIANIDNLAEKVPNKFEEIKTKRIEKAKVHFDKLESRCRRFVQDIMRQTEKDMEDLKKPVPPKSPKRKQSILPPS